MFYLLIAETYGYRRICYLFLSDKAPPYIFPLLIISKRLHSIFLLRLFNDCFAIAALFLAIYAYQRRVWTVGSIAYSWGVGTKMTLLLAAPAIGVIILQALPLRRSMNAAFLMAQVQVSPRCSGVCIRYSLTLDTANSCITFSPDQYIWLYWTGF